MFDDAAGPPADEARRRDAIGFLATVAARAVALAARHGVVLKVSPRRVGSDGGVPVYLGVMRGPEALDAGFIEGMLRWADAAGDAALAEHFGALLLHALRQHATPADLAVVDLAPALAAFRPTSEAGARLVAALAPGFADPR